MNPVISRILMRAKEKGLSQKQFAIQIGVHPQVITDWKKKASATSYNDRIAKIAEVLDVSTDYLLTGEKEKPALQSEDGLSEKDGRLLTWFRSLSQEKQKAILIAQDAPEELVSDLDH